MQYQHSHTANINMQMTLVQNSKLCHISCSIIMFSQMARHQGKDINVLHKISFFCLSNITHILEISNFSPYFCQC